MWGEGRRRRRGEGLGAGVCRASSFIFDMWS